MFTRLKDKWGVSFHRVILILCTFAIGGSACGYLGRLFMPLLGIDNTVLWLITYILVVTIIWPICVIVISIPFGQFRFFTGYLARMGKRMFGRREMVEKDLNQQNEITNNKEFQTKETAQNSLVD